MATRTLSPIRGKRIRLTGLDSCGRYPEAGDPDAFLTTDGFVSVQLSTVVEDGAEIMVKNANGDIHVNEKQSDSFKRFTAQIAFTRVNPSALALVSNAKPYELANGDVAGVTIAEGMIQKWFGLELWTGLSGRACDETVEEASGYMLLPFLQAGTIADLTVDGENAVSFNMQGAYTKGGNAWGVGPYHVLLGDLDAPSFLPAALDPLDHFLLVETGLAPPPNAESMQPMVTGGASTTTTTTP